MKETEQLNSDRENIARSALFTEKIHSCADCPIRKLAIKQPKSIFSRLHAWHSTWWPGWKAHQASTCPFSVSVNNPAQ
jgi:hypothetical protein